MPTRNSSTMRIRPLFLVALILVGSTLTIRPAAACTCGPFDARKTLSEAPAAFVGTLIARDPLTSPDGSGREVFRFQVDQVVKGELGPIVAVQSEGSEASCGLSASPDRPVGIILSEVDGAWHSSLCRQTSPERLVRAGAPLPPPDAQPPPDLVLGSTYGGGRATGLRFDGRVTGLGAGPGTTVAVSACPDRAHVAELFTTVTPEGAVLPAVAVRETATLAVVFQRTLPDHATSPDPGAPPEAARSVDALACRTAGGGDVVVAARKGDDSTGRAEILRIIRPSGPADPADGTVTLLWQGAPYRHAAFGPSGDVAYLGLAPAGEDLVAVELGGSTQSSAARPVATLPPGSGAVTVSPDGLRLATVAVSMSQPTRLALVDMRTNPASPRIFPLSGVGIAGQMLWAGRDRVVFAPRIRPDEPVLVFDTDLRVLHSWTNWVAERSVATASGVLYGAGPDLSTPNTTLVRQAALDTGVVNVVREIEDALVFDMVDLSDPGATRAGEPPGTRGNEVSTTTTTAPASTPAPRPQPRPAPAVTTTTTADPSVTPNPPAGPTTPVPDRPGPAAPTTRTPDPPEAPPAEEALPSPRDGGAGGGGGGWLSGWILLVLLGGVGAALGTAALLSGGLTAIRKRT